MIKIVHIIILALSMLVSASASLAFDNKGNDVVQANQLINNSSSTLTHDPDMGIEMLFAIENKYTKTSMFDDRGERKGILDHLDRLESSFTNSNIKLELPPVVNEFAQIGTAFITNFTLHEMGHSVMADYIGARGVRYSFLKKNEDGQFFLAESTYDEIDEESILSFSIAGEIAADLTFEHALQSYRKDPSLGNTSLLFFSGTDFLWYCFYAYYLTDGDSHYDPTAIAKETGISKDTIFSIALAKTLINAYRVYSGKDHVVPYFAADKHSASLNFRIYF